MKIDSVQTKLLGRPNEPNLKLQSHNGCFLLFNFLITRPSRGHGFHFYLTLFLSLCVCVSVSLSVSVSVIVLNNTNIFLNIKDGFPVICSTVEFIFFNTNRTLKKHYFHM